MSDEYLTDPAKDAPDVGVTKRRKGREQERKRRRNRRRRERDSGQKPKKRDAASPPGKLGPNATLAEKEARVKALNAYADNMREEAREAEAKADREKERAERLEARADRLEAKREEQKEQRADARQKRRQTQPGPQTAEERAAFAEHPVLREKYDLSGPDEPASSNAPAPGTSTGGNASTGGKSGEDLLPAQAMANQLANTYGVVTANPAHHFPDGARRAADGSPDAQGPLVTREAVNARKAELKARNS